ncbi:MAG: YbhB/YbcL family Raf kinase inhibitor-like protein [Candidatus Omnitrophica bacterium]|nr:YbhB/YbcL family Raf kinase inhibitor-like protein [Candidatus Omnitrophota bacterium]
MKISSPDFMHNALLPGKFTCMGLGVNPALVIEGIPGNTKTLAIIMDDPDAPRAIFVHWIVYNIPSVSMINKDSIPGTEGINTTGSTAYVPPCPPSGTHRYFFKVYALDKELNFDSSPDKRDLEAAMQGHIIGSAEIIGLVKR